MKGTEGQPEIEDGLVVTQPTVIQPPRGALSGACTIEPVGLRLYLVTYAGIVQILSSIQLPVSCPQLHEERIPSRWGWICCYPVHSSFELSTAMYYAEGWAADRSWLTGRFLAIIEVKKRTTLQPFKKPTADYCVRSHIIALLTGFPRSASKNPESSQVVLSEANVALALQVMCLLDRAIKDDSTAIAARRRVLDRAWQVSGASWMLVQECTAIKGGNLADQCGLGKTLQAQVLALVWVASTKEEPRGTGGRTSQP
ncbi:hypothetical protein BJX99DRAFT_259731 [Aspergillus californicus]